VRTSQAAPAVAFSALENGEEVDIVHFASINTRDGFYLTARQPIDDFSWSDLEGRDVLVDHLFQPLATLRYAMHLNAADFDRINVIDAGNVDQMDKAFREGNGAFVHQQGPAPQQLEQDDQGHMIASIGEAIGPIAFSSLCATPEWLQTDMAAAFVEAYQQGMNAVVERSAEQIADVIHQSLPGIDREVLVKTLDDYKALDTWQSDISIDSKSYETLLDVFIHAGTISSRFPMKNCVVEVVR
jgi:NitT/TauT family transport system substrate-binding protein